MDVEKQDENFLDQLPNWDHNMHMPCWLSTKGEILLHSIPFLGLPFTFHSNFKSSLLSSVIILMYL